MFASRDGSNKDEQGVYYLPHSAYTKHPFGITPGLDCRSKLPSQARSPEYRLSQASSQSCRSSLSVITDDFPVYDQLGEHSLTLEDHFMNINSPDPLHTIDAPFPRYGACRYITETDRSYRLMSYRGIMNLGAVFLIFGGLIAVFVGCPMWLHFTAKQSIHLDTPSSPLTRRSKIFSQFKAD